MKGGHGPTKQLYMYVQDLNWGAFESTVYLMLQSNLINTVTNCSIPGFDSMVLRWAMNDRATKK